MKPEGIKSGMDVVAGIHKSEAKTAARKHPFDEGINERLKSAILIGMLPKEFQDMVLQTFAVSADFKFEGIRDYVINVANNRAQLNKPSPHLNAMEQGYEGWDGWGEGPKRDMT